MTEKPDPTQDPTFVATGAVGDEKGDFAEAGIAVQGTQALLVARFADTEAASDAYEALREAESEKAINIQGVLVVDADDDGKVTIRKLTDHHTRTGMAWGAVAGAALALVFPPSLLAGAALGGIAGAAAGKIGNISTKSDLAKDLADVITPGSSGILAVVDLTAVDAVKDTIPEADEVQSVPIDQETAEAVTDAAKSAAVGAGA
jgi:uncharacterized membrane protein